MSRLLNSNLCIGIAPEYISCLRLDGWLRPRIASMDRLSCSFEDGVTTPWAAALSSLRTYLQSQNGEMAVKFILSNQFFRFVALPANSSLNSNEEWLGYARYRINQIYGETAQSWVLTISPTRQKNVLVSAIDRELVEQLRAICLERHLDLKSIQPYFAKIFNLHRKTFANSKGWLVVEEACHCTVSLLDQGAWILLTTRRLFSPSSTELFDMLDREHHLHCLDTSGYRDIWIKTAHPQQFFSDSHSRYRLHNLHHNLYPLSQNEEASYALVA